MFPYKREQKNQKNPKEQNNNKQNGVGLNSYSGRSC